MGSGYTTRGHISDSRPHESLFLPEALTDTLPPRPAPGPVPEHPTSMLQTSTVRTGSPDSPEALS